MSLELVRAGLAWHGTTRNTRQTPCLQAEVEARRAKVGLWSMPSPVPPWEWRRVRRRQVEAGCAGSPLLVRDAVVGGNKPQKIERLGRGEILAGSFQSRGGK